MANTDTTINAVINPQINDAPIESLRTQQLRGPLF